MSKEKIESTQDLRTFLLGQMQGVADGSVDTDKAKGVCNLSQQIYNTLNLELKLATAKAKHGDSLTVESVSFKWPP